MFRDAVKEDMQGLSVTEEDARDWVRWRQIIYLYEVFVFQNEMSNIYNFRCQNNLFYKQA